MSMNCSAFRRQLEELSSDRFPCDLASSHAAACPACGDFYREHLALNKLIQSIEPVCAPPDFDGKLNARLDVLRHARPTRRFLYLNFIPGTASIAFASVFALAVCTAVLLKETPSGNNNTPRVAQQTQSVAARTDFHESALPSPVNDVPAVKRIAYTNIASASPKITTNSPLKKLVADKSKSNFNESRREAFASEKDLKDPKAIGIPAPQTKSVVFSSGAAPIVTRPAATNSTNTQNPSSALIDPATKSAQAADQLIDPFLASGAETKTLTAQLAPSYGVRGGLLVVSVQPQSAAFRVGLRSGDVIEAVNNQSLSGARLPQNLKDTNALSLAIVRNNQRLSITLPVAQSTHQ